MTKAGPEWFREFGPDDDAAKQVANGVGFVFDKRKGSFTAGHFDQRVEVDNFDFSKDPEALEAINTEVRELVRLKKVVQVTKDKDNPAVVKRVLPIFAIHQGSKWRMVWDGRKLNEDVYK